MIIFVQIICIFLAVLLVILVILQQGKGSDLGSAFGGGSSNSMFGALGPSNLLGRLTWIIGSLFLIFAMTQAVLLKNLNDQDDFNFPEQENVIEETDELEKAIESQNGFDIEEEIGDLLMIISNLAQKEGIDSEQALNRANKKFIKRFKYIEEVLKKTNTSFNEVQLNELDSLWRDSKKLD